MGMDARDGKVQLRRTSRTLLFLNYTNGILIHKCAYLLGCIYAMIKKSERSGCVSNADSGGIR